MKTIATALCTGLVLTVLLLGSVGESYQAWAQSVENLKVTLAPYGKDLSDGSIGGVFPLGENRYYIDDAQGRSGTKNVYFRLTYQVAENEITAIFDQIGTNSPPANTLEIGAKIELTGASFASGATETTVKGFQFNWNPPPGPIRKTFSIVLDEPVVTAPEVTEAERIQVWRNQNLASAGSPSSSSTISVVQVRSLSYYEDLAGRDIPPPKLRTKSLNLDDYLTLGVAGTSYKPYWNIFLQLASFSISDFYLPLGIKFDLGRAQWASETADSVYFYKFFIDPLLCYFTYRFGAREKSAFQLSLGGSPLSFNAYESYQDSTYRTGEKFWKPFLDAHLQVAFPLGKDLSKRASILSLKVGYCNDFKNRIAIENQNLESRNGAYLILSCGISGKYKLLQGITPNSQARYATQVHQRALELQQADIRAAQEAAEPCDLSLAITFDDEQSYFPNDGFLESTENALFHVKVKNSGTGPGYETKLIAQLLNSPKGITLERSEVAVGDIPGNSGSLDCSMGISANASMTGDKARILFRAVEKRGFNSRDYIIELPLRPVAMPTLAVVGHFTIQDGTDGYAAGNKNGVIENGETVEINGYVKNQGKGPAAGVQAALSNLPLGVEGVISSMDLGPVESNQTVPVRFAIRVPADFKLDPGKNLSGLITLTEARNLTFPPSQQTFPFAYRTTRLTASFDQSPTMENGKTYPLTLHVTNTAELPARDVTVKVSAANGVTVDNASFKLTQLTQQALTSNTINVTIPRKYTQSELNLTVSLEQATFGTLSYPFTFKVRPTAPKIQITPQVVGDFTVAFMQPFDVRVDLFNSGDQTARGLNVTVVISNGIYNQTKSERVGDLSPLSGKPVPLNFPVIPRNLKGNALGDRISIPILITVTEQDFNIEPKTVDLTVIDDAPLVQALQADKPVPMFTGGGTLPGGGVITGPLPQTLDAPVDVPVSSGMNNPNALAIILGVEKYEYLQPATFAKNDASTFRAYARMTLGIPEENIIYKINDEVKTNDMKKLFGEKEGMLARRKNSRLDVYIYFAGHGGSDLQTKEHYLIPADGDQLYMSSTCYNVDDLISQLDKLDVHSVTLFLDACFSGVSRENEVLAAADGEAKRPGGVAATDLAAATNKVTVFSAASGPEPSNSYRKKEHGLFTYCLLQGLNGAADTDGDRQITVGELGQYVEKNMSNLTLKLKLSQTPQIQIKDQQRVIVDFK